VRRVTTIYIPIDVLEKLKQLKLKYRAKKYSDVIVLALEAMEKLEKLRVASFVCVEKGSARATPVAWAKMFQSANIVADQGFYFLKADGSELVVDRDKCVGFFKELGLTYSPQAQPQGEPK
jgi:hypothetical protein